MLVTTPSSTRGNPRLLFYQPSSLDSPKRNHNSSLRRRPKAKPMNGKLLEDGLVSGLHPANSK